MNKISQIDAAYSVLKKAKKPLTTLEICRRIEDKGIWKSPHGKSPDRTLVAEIVRERKIKGRYSRFKRTAPGEYTLRGRKYKNVDHGRSS